MKKKIIFILLIVIGNFFNAQPAFEVINVNIFPGAKSNMAKPIGYPNAQRPV